MKGAEGETPLLGHLGGKGAAPAVGAAAEPGLPGGPARPEDAAPRPPVCPVSSAALLACMNHLPTVHRAGEDQQGAAAAFTGRQSHLNSRFCSRSYVSALNRRRGREDPVLSA